MQTVRFIGRVAKPRTIKVGVELDNNVETIQFELPHIADGQLSVLYWTDGAGHADADSLTAGRWTISNTMTQYPGEILCYITIWDGDTKRWHSEVFVAEIPALPNTEGTIDQTYPSAIQAGVEAAAASAAAAVSAIAATYDPPYDYGEYMTREGHLYRALQDIPEDEEYTAGHWTQITVMDEVGGAVMYDRAQGLSSAQQLQAVENIKAVGALWELEYTADQQQAARYNIGLPIIDWLMELTDTQKNYARLNISAKRMGISPEAYGAKGDGTTDDANALLLAFKAAYESGLPVSMDEGKTYITSRDIYIYGRIHIYGNGATIKVKGDLEEEITHILYINDEGDSTQTPPIPSHPQWPGDKQTMCIENLTLDGNGKATTCLFIGYAKTCYINDVHVCGFTETGIRSQSGFEQFLNNIWIAGENTTGTTGIKMYASDSKFTNIVCKNVATGILNYGAANIFDHLHHWNSGDTVTPESVAIDAYASFIATHTYIDTCAVGVAVHGDLAVQMTGTYVLNDLTNMGEVVPTVFSLTEASQAARIKSWGMVNLSPDLTVNLFDIDTGSYTDGFPWGAMNDDSIQVMGNFPD